MIIDKTGAPAPEYLCAAHPDASGFSPRNLRRMREFYRAYENAPEVLAVAMACMVYAERFPRQVRNQKKQELSTQNTGQAVDWTVHTLEIFWWGEDYCVPADVEPDEDSPLWSVHVEYSNKKIQDKDAANSMKKT